MFFFPLLHCLFSYVEPPFYSWDKFPLVMVYNHLNVLLNMVCYCFVEEICMHIYQEYWCVIFL